MDCPKCRKTNRIGAKFCAHCGTTTILNMTVKVCSRCKRENRLEAKFCLGCGRNFSTLVSSKKQSPVRGSFYVGVSIFILVLVVSSILLLTFRKRGSETRLARITPTIEPVVAFPTAWPQPPNTPTAIVIEVEPTPISQPAAATQSLSSEALNRALLATVQILVPGDNGKKSSGSGSILTKEGYILTNFHVVGDQLTGELYNNSGNIWIGTSSDDLKQPAEIQYLAEVVEYNRALDLALIKIISTKSGEALPANLNLTTLPIGNAETVQIGQELSIIGFPGLGGDSVTFTKGTVSGFLSDEGWVKTDAEINFGNSGGAAINQAGELVGVPSAAAGETVDLPGKIGLVRPLNMAQPLIDRALREGTP